MAVQSPGPGPLVASPCIDVCEMDPRTKLCLGCGRTIQEIARWSALSEDEKRRIVERLKLQGYPRGRR